MYPVNCIYIIIAKCTEKGFSFGAIDIGKDYLAPLITLEKLLEIILKRTPPYQNNGVLLCPKSNFFKFDQI
jgi:hypothetical protein